MRKYLHLVAAIAVAAGVLYSAETRIWEQADYADFEKGGLKKLTLRSDGRLTLAPAFREILDSSSAYLWAMAEDSKGNLYAGGGGPGGPGARVYVVTPDGKSRVFAELEGLEIHAIAVDRQDRVYAATSPDGKVFRIAADGKPQLFYDPLAKYIWAMAFDSKGNLFLATGDDGVVHKVSSDGKGSVFFRTEETHARSMAIDSKDNLILGTEPGGLILRVAPAGDGFVLYQAAKREITAVAVGPEGAIYAAAVGNKQPGVPQPPLPPPPKLPESAGQPGAQPPAHAGPGAQRPQPPPSLGFAPPAITGGTEVYRIDPDGLPMKIWSHANDIVYAIALDPQGRPLLGAGNKGSIYRIESDRLHTALLNASPTQVTGFCAGRKGKLYAATGNVGKVYQIGPELEKEGTIDSEVFDAGLLAYWGRLAYRGQANGGAIRLETRSGNLDRPVKDWSPWAPLTQELDGGRVQSPAARFLQWRMTLKAADNGRSPVIESVQAAYLTKNATPVIEVVEITPPNYKFPPQSLLLTPSQNITLTPLGRGKKTPPPAPITTSAATSMQYDKGFIGARWEAKDANGDLLLYKAEIRGAGESQWKLLKDKLKDKQLSWDSTAYPDGRHEVRVTASDSPDNTPDQALTAVLESEPFLIDNTAPEIVGLAASPAGARLVVTWKATDAGSIIQKAEYSVNGGEWTVVLPVTRLSDSRSQEYRLELERPASGEQTVAVRVADEFDNQSVAKVVVR